MRAHRQPGRTHRQWSAGMRVLSTVLFVACHDPATVAPKPIGTETKPSLEPVRVLATDPAQGAISGAPFSYDVLAGGTRFSDPRASGLTYQVTLLPANAGFTVSNGRIAGVAPKSGIVRVTIRATDQSGSAAETTLPIFVFASDLTAPVLPSSPYAYSDGSSPLPVYFANSPTVHNADNMPVDNAVTDAGAALGRVLFYDRRLSANDRVSCASCHLQSAGFSDTALLSRGFEGNVTARHSMALTDVRFYRPARFFRDERAATLEELVLQPVSDAIEMGLPAGFIAPKLSLAGYYRPLFRAAFGNDSITTEGVARALSQFVRSLVSKDSPFDRMQTFQRTASEQEREGEALFVGTGCRDCHESYAFVNDAARNNGLDLTVVDQGAGQGRFKAPSLRNVAVRTAFMHDARFRTLEEVIDFYDARVIKSPALDRRLLEDNGQVRRLNLTLGQKQSLMAFLNSLTDETFLRDPKFSDPFAR